MITADGDHPLRSAALTNDLDVVLSSARGVTQLPGLFPATNFICRRPTLSKSSAAGQPRAFQYYPEATGYKADVYLSGSDPLHAWGFEHRRRTLLEGGDVWLAPARLRDPPQLEYYQEGGSANISRTSEPFSKTPPANSMPPSSIAKSRSATHRRMGGRQGRRPG